MVKGYCQTCKKTIELKDVEIKAMKKNPMDYYLGYCPFCNRKFSIIKGKNNSDKFFKIRLEITNEHISKIQAMKMADLSGFDSNNLTEKEWRNLGLIFSALKNHLKKIIIKDLIERGNPTERKLYEEFYSK